jgi:hypothetical protein
MRGLAHLAWGSNCTCHLSAAVAGGGGRGGAGRVGGRCMRRRPGWKGLAPRLDGGGSLRAERGRGSAPRQEGGLGGQVLTVSAVSHPLLAGGAGRAEDDHPSVGVDGRASCHRYIRPRCRGGLGSIAARAGKRAQVAQPRRCVPGPQHRPLQVSAELLEPWETCEMGRARQAEGR